MINIYKNIFSSSSTLGIARHSFIRNNVGEVIDFIFLETNKTFESITGVDSHLIFKKPFKNIISTLDKDLFDWANYNVSILKNEKEFEQYSQLLEKWYKAHVFFLNDNEFVTLFTDITEQKRVTGDLENFFNVNLDLLCIADMSGLFVKVNKAWGDILGYSGDELIGRNFMDFVHPDDLQATIEAISILDEGSNVFNFVNRYLSNNGDYHSIEWRSHPHGKLIYAAARDITERIKYEETLKKKEHLLNLFFNSSLDGFFFMMLDEPVEWNEESDKEALIDYVFRHQRVTEVNQAMLNQYGYKMEEFIGLTPIDLFYHDIPYGKKVWIEFFDNGRLHIDTTEKRKDESEFWAEGDYICLYDEQGRITGHFGVQRDISESKQNQIALKKERQRLENIIEGTNTATWEWDIQTGKTFFNERWAGMLGYKLQEIEPTTIETWNRFLHPDDISVSNDMIERHFKGIDSYYECEVRVKHKNGSWIWVVDRGRVFEWSEDGKPLKMLGTHIDITDRKLIEAELRAAKIKAESASKAKSDFLANMSHEIRTPLNGVIGFTDLLMKTGLSELQLQYMQNVGTSAHSLMDIINDILDLSKIEAGKLELNLEKTAVHNFVNRSIEVIQYSAHSKKLELLLDVALDLPATGVFDQVRLKQVLINILGNAVKFTHKGEVKLSVNFEKANDKIGRFIFSISDTGIGISDEQQKRLFYAFSQADMSTTRKYGGTGLGLVISNKLLEKMDSVLDVKSVPGKGSIFSFAIETEYYYEPLRIGDISTIKKVLIIDDNKSNRDIVYNMLKYKSIDSDAAKSGDEAIDFLLAGNNYDVIIMDYNMPDKDGLYVISQIKARFSNVKHSFILLYSSSEDAFIHQECKRLGVFARIVKPVKMIDFFDALAKAILPSVSMVLQENEEIKTIEKSNNGKGITVIIAEDNLLNMTLAVANTQSVLPAAKIIEAINGEETVKFYKEHNPDIILMDCQMPIKDGYSATEDIRDIESDSDKHCYIIALTAGAIKGEKEHCLNSGMDAYLTKPLDYDVFEQTILDAISIFKKS